MAYYNRTIKAILTKGDGTAFVVDTNAYLANDVIGGLALASYPGGGALLRKVKVKDNANKNVALTLYIYDSTPTAIVDNAAFTPLEADGQKEIDQISIAAGDYKTAPGSAYSVAYIKGADADVDIPGDAGGLLHIYVVPGAGVTYDAATDLEITLFFWVD